MRKVLHLILIGILVSNTLPALNASLDVPLVVVLSYLFDSFVIVITGESFARMALSFAGAEQVPHFERIGFKATGRRMFATYLAKDNTANIFLTPKEQSVFCRMEKSIYPVPNKWGEKGATTFDLDHVPKHIVLEALLSAYNEIIGSKGGKSSSPSPN